MKTRYKDLAGYSYETEWHLNPFIYERRRYTQHRGIEDLGNVVQRAVGKLSPDGQEEPGTQRKGPVAEREEEPGVAREQRSKRTAPAAEKKGGHP